MIPFLKWNKIYLVISSALILTGLVSILVWGFTYSIEFVGGSNLRYQVNTGVTKEQVEEVLADQNIEGSTVEVSGKEVQIRTKPLSETQEAQLRQQLGTSTNNQITVLRTETVGPSMSQDTVNKTLIAAGIAIVGILLYVAFAFRNLNFALAAVIALFHDVFIVIGAYSLMSHFFGAEVDTLFVTAVLTTMSFSVHDTIVMFDQIRSYVKKYGTGDLRYIANRSITETIMRSINNSLTIVFMLLALVLLGGSTIRFFAASLLIGTIIGTYSSPFVSVPIAVWLEKRKKK